MLSRLKTAGFRSLVSLTDKPQPEPERLFEERPVVGFYAALSPEQKSMALAYRGDENHGDMEFKKARA